MPDTRPVWITREQRDLLALHGWRKESAAWDAAPADTAVNVRDVVLVTLSYDSRCERVTDAVLRALGMPERSA